MENIVLFVLGTIGMTHIIVDGKITAPFRDWVKRTLPESISDIVDCYVCTGTWCGFFVGFFLISHSPVTVFVCGCAGSFVSYLAASVLGWIESSTAKNLGHIPQNPGEK